MLVNECGRKERKRKKKEEEKKMRKEKEFIPKAGAKETKKSWMGIERCVS